MPYCRIRKVGPGRGEKGKSITARLLIVTCCTEERKEKNIIPSFVGKGRKAE